MPEISRSRRTTRAALAITGIALCLWGICSSSAFGVSRLLAKYSLASRSREIAETAIQLSPQDARAYQTAATLISLGHTPAEALAPIEMAASLRPADYSLWLAVGLTRDRLGDSAGATAAFNEAVKRAPFYAQPTWQRGNLLLRSGQTQPAFIDLNNAAKSDPELLRKVIDLAWNVSHHDVERTRELAQVKTGPQQLALARLLAREGQTEEAVKTFLASGINADDLHRQLVAQLLARGAYQQAHELWSRMLTPDSARAATEEIYDGGFEGALNLNEEGFGWRVWSETKAMTVSLTEVDPNSGTKSLSINFRGDANPATPIVSQLVMVDPSRTYRINLAAKSKDIVSGGPPIAVARTASDKKLLAQSPLLITPNGGWQVFSWEFSAPAGTNAALLGIERDCRTSPCPIFGSLYLDSFSIQRIK